jgi:hypothetical protein
VILTAFFDYWSVVHHDYAPLGQTIIKEYYQEALCHLHDVVRCKRPELFLAVPILKTLPKGTRFDSRKDVIQNMTAQPHNILNKPFRSASNYGRTTGLSVWSHKGRTLKGIRYCNHNDTGLCFPCPRLHTFWTDLVSMGSVL